MQKRERGVAAEPREKKRRVGGAEEVPRHRRRTLSFGARPSSDRSLEAGPGVMGNESHPLATLSKLNKARESSPLPTSLPPSQPMPPFNLAQQRLSCEESTPFLSLQGTHISDPLSWMRRTGQPLM
jgi:hypothetical protein